MKKTYRSIFISDLHLGSRGCKAETLCDFLKHNTAENLFLVGDIIDGWRLQKQWYWPQEHSNVIREILTASKKGSNVVYVVGNHDEEFRRWLHFMPQIGNLKVVNRYDYTGIDGVNRLVIHGDMFDTLMHLKTGRWLMKLGDTLYDFIIKLNDMWAIVRSKLGMSYWSMSKWIKDNTKHAVKYVLNFEELMSDYCNSKGYAGIICGHIHKPEIKMVGDISYMNTGDFVENCSALVEHHDGRWEIIIWSKGKNDVGIDTSSGKHKQSKRHSGKSDTGISDTTSV